MASLTCSDASPWSDITDPLSPPSPVSSQPSPLGQTLSEGSSTAERIADSVASTGNLPAVCPSGSSRRRRHSETFPARDEVPNGESGGKRFRRPSGHGDRSSGSSNWPSNTKWLTYVLKSSAGPEKDLLDIPNRNSTSQTTVGKRQSWPLNNNNNNNRTHQQQPAQQLKITEFFSAQVKHHWSYSKASAGLKELKERLPATVAPFAEQDQIQRIPSTSPADCPSQVKATSAPQQQIRFPAHQRNGAKSEPAATPSPDIDQCLWKNCGVNLAPGQSLLDHIQSAHVSTQASSPSSSSSAASSPVPEFAPSTTTTEQYSCEWEGCKVQGKKCKTRAWLEQHVLMHVGKKPFRCIVDGCEQRFSSEVHQKKKMPIPSVA